MKYIAKENDLVFALFHVRVSETELEIYENCLDYFIKNFDEKTCKLESGGATLEELEGMRDSLRHIIATNFDKKNMPNKAHDWQYALSEKLFGEL
jgi:hypothetical protein